MMFRLFQLATISVVALYLVPHGAHFFERPAKMALSPESYMIVQSIYAGWSRFGLVIVAALLMILAHTVLVRDDRQAFWLSLLSFAALAGVMTIFWLYTYPVNVESHNWTVKPEPFEAAQRQWEFSHAANAILTSLSLLAVAFSALSYQGRLGRISRR